jgi:hypothetical protein
MSYFVIDMPMAYFKADYWSEKLLKYTVKIFGDNVERNGTTAYKMIDSVHCTYSAILN